MLGPATNPSTDTDISKITFPMPSTLDPGRRRVETLSSSLKVEWYMIWWTFTPDDVARIRFAFSPLLEAVFSLIVLRDPGRHSLHLPWVRATRPLVAALDLAELFALVPVCGDTVDFLTLPPSSPLPDLAAELEVVRRTPPDTVVAELAAIDGMPARIARAIRADPAAARDRIADTLEAYWNLALREHWPRIRAVLEADVLWRSRRLAVGGARALFEDLHETVVWHRGRLSAEDPHHFSGSLSGEGMLLAPNVMCWPNVRKMFQPYQAMLVYPVRGIATLWETGVPPPPDALAALVGRTRAALLIALAEPLSTTALARGLTLTPSAISQQLAVLLDCGLVTRTRAGRLVLYRRTRSADALVPDAAPQPRPAARPARRSRQDWRSRAASGRQPRRSRSRGRRPVRGICGRRAPRRKPGRTPGPPRRRTAAGRTPTRHAATDPAARPAPGDRRHAAVPPTARPR
jgi:DNA-binding transcriptional ArsR family regulator